MIKIPTKRINHKLVGLITGIGFLFYVGLNVNNYMQISNEILDVNTQISNYRDLNKTLSSTINVIPGKLSTDTNLSYYAGSIYAYALLEDFQIDIRSGETKYKDTMPLNLFYSQFQDKNKFKEFIKSLSYLGYVENVTSKNLTLHVTNFTIDDAIKLNKSNKNKE